MVKDKAREGAADPPVEDEQEDESEDEEETEGGRPSGKASAQLVQHYVDHSYTDYAVVVEDDLRLLDENSSLLPTPSNAVEASAREKLRGMSCTYGPLKKNAGGVVQPFPGKVSSLVRLSWNPAS